MHPKKMNYFNSSNYLSSKENDLLQLQQLRTVFQCVCKQGSRCHYMCRTSIMQQVCQTLQAYIIYATDWFLTSITCYTKHNQFDIHQKRAKELSGYCSTLMLKQEGWFQDALLEESRKLTLGYNEETLHLQTCSFRLGDMAGYFFPEWIQEVK